MSDDTAQRQQLIDTALAMNASGINQGMAGNLSLRVDDGFLITPSGMRYDRCEPEDMVLMDLAGDWQGERKPSSEWRFHRDIYAAREDAGAVLHAHSPWSTTLACLHKGIPAFHYMVAMAGGKDIRCASYETFGTQELSDAALEALTDRKACLLGNHGLLVLESNLEKALSLAIEVENLARCYCQALAIGEPAILGDEEMSRVLEKFKGYGSNAQRKD